MSLTLAPSGQPKYSAPTAAPPGSVTAKGTATATPTHPRPDCRSSAAAASLTGARARSGSAGTGRSRLTRATVTAPRPMSATAKPSVWISAASATGPFGSGSSRCDGRPRWPPPGDASTSMSRRSRSSPVMAPVVARVTPSLAVSADRVGAAPV